MGDFSITQGMARQAAHARQDQAALQLVAEAARTADTISQTQSESQSLAKAQGDTSAVQASPGSGRGGHLDTSA